jgi:dihydrofolate synthase/folylpolyglutamate synthase
MTYAEAVAYLDRLTNFERAHDAAAMRGVRLERIRHLCERLGQPQQRFRSILVAGTNSKGSTCAMIYEILRAAGLRAGLYTSPHIDQLRERIRVGGPSAAPTRARADWITQEEFVRGVAQVRQAIDGATWHDGPPTYFEAVTAVALGHFARKQVDVAVLEVGLGGRLDATNIVEPVVSVLGPVGTDHTDVLGEDALAIAREKLGVARPGRALVCGLQTPEVGALVRDVAGAQGCRIVEYGRDVQVQVLAHGLDGSRVTVRTGRGLYEGLVVPLIGRHQADNAAMAIAAVEALSGEGMPHTAVHVGLARVRWPGRLELVQERPAVLLDGGHNPEAAKALRQTIQELWPERAVHLILGLSADKPMRAIGEILAPIARSVICTRSHHPRACDAAALAEQLDGLGPAPLAIPDPVDAYTYALNTAAPEDLVVAAGSLFLVGELTAALRSAQSARERARLRRSKPAAAAKP